MKLLVPLNGSIQNPSFSPDGKAFMFTRWRGGYNLGASDIYVTDIRDRERVSLVTKGDDLAGRMNASASGYRSTWTAQGLIAFASDYGRKRDYPWPALIRPDGSSFRYLPGGDGGLGLAPTMSPSGEEFAFERCMHPGEPGAIIVSMTEFPSFQEIGKGSNPSWSPDGRSLAWQVKEGDEWRIAYHDIESGETRRITPAGRSFTGPTWHAESDRLLCAGENAVYEVTLLGKVTVVYSVEHPRTAYIGAPSWSPEIAANKRRRLLCEGSDREDPEGGPGTWLEIY